jgi:hypothetical protein
MNHSAVDLRSRSSLPHPARRFASDERRPLLLPWIGWTPWLLLDRGVPEEVEEGMLRWPMLTTSRDAGADGM